MKQLLALLLLVALSISVFTGCKTTMEVVNPDAAKTFVVNLSVEPKTFDPTLNATSDGGHIINNVFEGLTADTPDGIKLAGANSYEVSEDGTVYVFKLRQDAKWSDGRPVTAKDYDYAWTRAMSSEAASEYSYIITPHIKGGQDYFDGKIPAENVGVIAVDDYTLKVELNYPVPYFLALTAIYTYYPVREDVVSANTENWFRDPETFVGNGPFTLGEYKTGSHLTLVPNQKYYGVDQIKVDSIKCVFITEDTTAYNAYQNGDIQVLDEMIPTEEIPNLMISDTNFTNEARVGTYYYSFNIDNKVLSDVRIRKALSYAIDRKSIVEYVLKGGEIPATGIIPNNLLDSMGKSFREGGVEFGIDPTKAKVEEAKELLAEAGYPNGEGFPAITITYNSDERNKKIAEAIQEMLTTNLGIKVKLINEEWASFQNTIREGRFEIARGGFLGDYADAITMLDLFTSYSGLNDSQWRYNEQSALAPHDKTLNPEQQKYDQLIADSMITSGSQRDTILREADRYLIEDNMIVMPIFYYSYKYLINHDKVTGIERSMMGQWIFKNAEVITK